MNVIYHLKGTFLWNQFVSCTICLFISGNTWLEKFIPCLIRGNKIIIIGYILFLENS